ncbi:MAG: HesA/MoeB/ThiF family protein [Arenicella sp.]|nr:HesA/MoeB/ThiF family protein [Arenicella sp.]
MTGTDARYSRQQRVGYFGEGSQLRLKGACVLIVGAGGLGSPVSLFLAGAGVGKIILVDHDVVSLSNLHRQILFQESDVNQPKVVAAKKRLRALNSELEVEVINAALSPSNAKDLVDQATVVVDAADNFLASYLLSDLCFASRTPLVTASVLTTHGYLGVFCGTVDRPAPSLRAVFASPSKTAANCNTAGVTGPSVGIIGSYQAQEVLKVILADQSQLLGKLMTLDLWNYSQNIIDFCSADEPKQYAPIIANNSLAETDLLLDVRSQLEVEQTPFFDNALNIPNTELLQRLAELPSSKRIVCVCASGQRALGAAAILLNNGFSRIYVTSAPNSL